MGLDLVELGLAIEDEFGVSVFAGGVFPETVGDLHSAIRHAVNRNILVSQHHCPAIPAFLSVRDALNGVLNAPERIRPSTSLSCLLPKKRRRQLWDQLESQLSVRLPPLHIDPRFTGPITLAWLAMCLLILLFGALTAESVGVLLAALVAVPLISLTLLMIFPSIRTVVPIQCSTVGQLVRRIAPTEKSISSGTRTDEYNWNRLLQIISDELDVPIDEIRAESHFVRDLKCG